MSLFILQTEYDNYISKLLDKQTPQNSRMLRDQVQQMTNRGTSRPKDLSDAKQKVVTLEEKATSSLEENERYNIEKYKQWKLFLQKLHLITYLQIAYCCLLREMKLQKHFLTC